MEFYRKSVDESLKELDSQKKGLSQSQVAARISHTKKMQLKDTKKTNIFIKFLSQLKDLMVLILLVSAVVSIVIGATQKSSSEIVDGLIILVIVFFNAVLGVVQESKTENAVEKLKKMTELQTVVLRDGKAEKIASSQLVVGDIVMLEAGSIVPADLRILECKNFKVNESMLTGESEAVEKFSNKISKEVPLGDRKNIAYSGSVVENGTALGVVFAVGIETEFGKIAESLKENKKDTTPLQKNIKEVAKVLTYIVLLIAGVTFILETLANKSEILKAFLTAVAISVAAIPESMPAVITIIMSLGIAELGNKKAIVKKMHAVETLGCCDIICTDKTGTITQNKMTVSKVYSDFGKNSQNYQHLINCMSLCNNSKIGNGKYVGDGMEVALAEYAKANGKIEKNERLDEMPFESGRNMMSTLNAIDSEKFVFVKGAIDKVLNHCSKVAYETGEKVLSAREKQKIFDENKKMCQNAMRVIALAYKKSDSIDEDNLTFLALVGMIDPPRPEIFDAVKKCKSAGMRPVMITGDFKDTAFAIAKEVGIANSIEEVVSGEELDKLSDEQFKEVVERASVYARVSPAHKSKIVEMLRANGHNVAMTGDGVNDAPSMKCANIGIGMGKGGTDVTKEVADMLILDDNFSTIIVAVEQGRKIYSNIQKTVKFLFSANMAEILSLFLITIFLPGVSFLLPVQILFINLITDSLPAIALGVEPVEKNVMSQKPRQAKEGLFSNGVGISIFVLGAVQTILTIAAFLYGYFVYNNEVAMTMAFYTLNLLQLLYMFTARTKDSCFKSNPFKNKFLIIAFLFGIFILALIAFTPLYSVLRLAKLDLISAGIVLLLSLSIIPIGELYKVIAKRIKK